MAYTLFTASYGAGSANFRVKILEVSDGAPAIITLQDGTVVNSTGDAVLDALGNLSVYLDNSKTFGVHINQYALATSDSTVATLVSRTAFQLASNPTAVDKGLGTGALFYDVTDPTVYYHISLDGTSFVAVTGNGSAAGAAGRNNATIFLYQRGNSSPALPNLPIIYTFSSTSCTGLSNGWQTTIPAGSAPIYVTLATASNSGLTDVITPNEWAAPVIFSQNGINSASVFLFQRTTTATPPSVPDTVVTYAFATGIASGIDNGWSQSLPVSGGAYRWMTDASALATSGVLTDTINPSEWSPVALLAQDGTDGQIGLNNAIVYAYQRAASVPATPSATVTYTFATGTTVGLNNGWTSTPPSGSLPIYITIASAASANPSDTISAGEWATPVIFAQNGAAGLNTATIFLYQVTTTSSIPALPSAAVTYTFSTAVATGIDNGWSQTLPTSGGSYRWITTAAALSITDTDVVLPTEWAGASLLAQDGQQGIQGNPGSTGSPGVNGLNNAVVLIYQRGTSAPALPSATVTYTFATAVTTGLTNGWVTAIPAGTDPIYVSSATASSNGVSDTIAPGEWATAVVLSQNGVGALNAATIYLFQRTATSTAPAVPSATITYTFGTGLVTGLTNGWSQSLVPVGGIYRWITTATALGTGTTDTIGTGEWATPSILAQDGSPGAGTFTLVGNANMTVSGGVATKTAGGSGYNGQAYSSQAYSNGAQMSMVVVGTDNIVAGLDTNPLASGGAGYAGINYAVTVGSNVMQVYESGVLQGSFGAVGNGDILGVRYDNSNVYYTLNGTNVRTLAVASGQKLYLDSSFGVLNASTSFTFSAAGSAGANGTSGSNGLRGSQTFYVTLSGSTATWSDALATTAASSGGGPILNDQVVESNASVGFSQSKLWNGSAWILLTQVINGSLLVTGTVAAGALSANSVNAGNIAAGSITASKLILSDFENLVFNAKGNSADGWTGSVVSPISNSSFGSWPSASASAYALGFQSTDNYYGTPFAVLPTDTFYVAMDTIPYGLGASTYAFSIGITFLDLNSAVLSTVSGAIRASGVSGFSTIAGTVATPTGAAYANIWVHIAGPGGTNFTANGQGHYATNIQVRRQNGANLIVDGSISANKITAGTITATQISATAGITAGQINSNGLSIKDSSGNVILSAGVPLASANITPAAGWVNSNISVDGSGNIQGIGTGVGTTVSNSILTPSITAAQSTANTAVTNASNAQSTANTAVTNASNAQSTANSAAAAAADRLSKSAASILSATVSINSVTGAGFVAGNLTWDGSGNRTGGSGVAMTPGGLIGYNGGTNTFSINSSTGNAYFGGTLAVGVASKGGTSSTLASTTTITGAATGLSTGVIGGVSYTVGGGDLLLICSLNVLLNCNTNTPYDIIVNLYDGSTTLYNSSTDPAPLNVGTLSNVKIGGSAYNWTVSANFGLSLLIPGGSLAAGSHTFGYSAQAIYFTATGSLNTITGSAMSCSGQMKIREFLA